MATNREFIRAFVVGPIGDRDAAPGSDERRTFEEAIQVFEEVIQPACQALGVESSRADQMARTGEIPEQIFRLLRDSDLVIADLTDANPNVMYELGLRHTTGKLTIQIGEKGRLPFDIAAIRTVLFKRTESGLINACRKLTQAIAVGLEDGGDPVTATRVWFESSDLLDLPPKDGSPDEQEDEPGFLEKIALAEEGMQSISATIQSATSIISEVTRLVGDASEETTKANQTGGGFSARLAVANRLAARLEDPASRFEIVAGEYSGTIKRIDPGMRYLVQRLLAEPSALKEAPDFPHQILGLVQAAEDSTAPTEQFRTNMRGFGEAARSLRRVTHRFSESIGGFMETSRMIVAWKPLVLELVELGPTASTVADHAP